MDKRGSGILLHFTSLPSGYGVGDLGPEAYRFADFLGQTRQRYWQVLPLNPTNPLFENSPYSSVSAFAGNTLLISPDRLIEEGLLSKEDLDPRPPFPEARCDFPEVIRYKEKLLERAFQHFNARGEGRESFEAFCSKNAPWLEDFALFVVLKKRFEGIIWDQWPRELRDRDLKALREVRKEFDHQIEREKFWQYLFFRQWQSIKDYCREKGVHLFGDNLQLFDVLRIDHFLGLVAYWEVPAGQQTAVNGRWVKAPGKDFLRTLKKHFPELPLVAEDLGVVTPEVKKLMARFGLPGMKVLVFAFGEDDPHHFLPHTYEKNFVVYTGTHDNNTVRGWIEGESSPEERQRLFRYLGREVLAEEVPWALIRLAMMSVAQWVILPMQDVLSLGGEARMNRPAIARGNWEWRLRPGQITPGVSERLLAVTETSGRG
jgi:4-alpha-glucanotransferase